MPAACVLGSFAVAIVVYLLIRLTGGGYWSGSGLTFGNLFRRLLTAGGLGLAGLWLSYPDGLPARAAGTNSAGAGSAAPAPAGGEGYIGMVQHVLLLLLTCGIWLYVWIYRTTGTLNRVEDEPPRNPTTKLLLCMFVPFYFIYWTYQSAQRVDKLAMQCGGSSDLTTLCLILAIFVPVIPPILMQSKINDIASGNLSAPAGQPQRRPSTGTGAAEELKTYTELLDSGAITQEEFDAKKRQLLDL